MRFYLAIIITFFCANCKNTEESITSRLTDNNYKFWDVVEMSGYSKDKQLKRGASYPNFCYYFDNKGNYKLYEYKKNKRILYDKGDIVIPETWKLITKDSLVLGNSKIRIEKLTNDTLIYKILDNRIVLAKSR